jgi:hypothetical protein
MRSLRQSMALVVASGFIACSNEPTANGGLASRSSELLLSDNASGPLVTGHASVIQQPSGALRTFSFSARMMPDGSVKGEYVNHNRQGGFVNHGEIDCLRLIGTNGAVMSGPIRKSDNPTAPPGGRTIFQVEDNGEGGTDAPDRVSMLFNFLAGGTEDCNNTTLTTAPIADGNIQVRP